MRLRFLKGDVRRSGERRRPRSAAFAAVLMLSALTLCVAASGAFAATGSWNTKAVAPASPAALSPALSAIQRTSAAAAAPHGKGAVTTIFSDGFESGMAGWKLLGNPGWGATKYRLVAGAQSAYCAGSSITPPGPYANNMAAWMIVGPYDLSSITAGTFGFKAFLDIEPTNDMVSAYVSLDGENFSGTSYWGNSGGWVDKSLDLTNVYTLGNVCGKTKVWFAFSFKSNPTVVYEGAYIDEVNITGTSPGGGTASLVLSADAEVVPYNGSVGLIGALLNSGGALIPNKSIDVYATQENSLTPDIVFLETLTSSTGEYSTRWSGIQKRTYFLTEFVGDTEYPGAIYSNLVKVMARALITPPAVPSTVRANVPITSWGMIKPPHTSSQNHASHTKVIVEHYLGGAWRSVLTIFATKYKNSSSATSYAITLRYAPGKWRVMGVHQDDDHAKSASAWRTFTAR